MAQPTYYTGVVSSVAGASKRHLTVFNDAGSGKLLRLMRVVVCGAPTAAVTGLVIPLHAARLNASAPTGGTLLTISKALTSSPAVPAQIVARTGATAATEDPVPFGVGETSGEESIPGGGFEIYRYALTGEEPVTCAENEGFVVKQGALASAGAVSVSVVFQLV